jgi:predicted NBD/HSP70 family sugar kinase
MHAMLAQGAGRPSHQEIADVAGVSKRFVTKTIAAFRSGGVLVGGHPAKLGPGLGMVLAISIGSGVSRAALVDANGELHHKREAAARPDQLHDSPEELLGRTRTLASEVLTQAIVDETLVGEGETLNLLGVAVAWPSPVDRDGCPGGRILRDPRWRRRPRSGSAPTLPQLTAKYLGGPFTEGRCHALNDANAHALAIAFDKSRERFADDESELWGVALVVLIGGGIGAATIMLAPHSPRRLSFIDSRLIAGTKGLAGELGHSPLAREVITERNRANPFDKAELMPFDYERAECSCGARHHLEAFASGRALERRLRASGYEIEEDSSGTSLHTTLRERPDACQSHALFDVGSILGSALANPILMLNPQSITLTGSFATKRVRDGILSKREVWRSAFDDDCDVTPLEGEDKEYIGVRGAGLAVLRRCVFRSFLEDGVMAEEPFTFGHDQLACLL